MVTQLPKILQTQYIINEYNSLYNTISQKLLDKFGITISIYELQSIYNTYITKQLQDEKQKDICDFLMKGFDVQYLFSVYSFDIKYLLDLHKTIKYLENKNISIHTLLIAQDYFVEYLKTSYTHTYHLEELPDYLYNAIDWKVVAEYLKKDYHKIEIFNQSYYYK
jgi:hypothetical protein